MATAYIDWSDDGNCEFGVTHLDQYNYNCPVSANGLHDRSYDINPCPDCGGREAYCLECGHEMCDCCTHGDAVELV